MPHNYLHTLTNLQQANREELLENCQALQARMTAVGETVGYLELSPKGEITYVNSIFSQWMGYDNQGLTGKNYKVLLFKEDLSSGATFWDQVATQQVSIESCRRKTKAGDEVWLQNTYNPLFNEDGSLKSIVQLAINQTKQKKATLALEYSLKELRKKEEELLETQKEERRSNLIFKALFDHSTDAHLLFDDTGLISCNHATLDMIGYDSFEELRGVHPAVLSPEVQPDGRKSMEKSIEMDQLARDKGYHRFEWIHRKKDGTDFPVEVTLNPISIDGKATLLVVWHDLTEQKKAEAVIKQQYSDLQSSEEELRQNSEELMAVNESLEEEKKKLETTLKELRETKNQMVQSEKMASLGQLTAGVAHEINNPVNFISGATQALRMLLEDMFELFDKYGQLSAEEEINAKKSLQKEIEELQEQKGERGELIEDSLLMLKDIESGVNRVTEIVKGLRNFSRNDQDEQMMDKLHQNIDNTLLILRNKYLTNIEIIKEYDESIDEIMCYPGQLSQVFMNIIGNAIDAIPEKGTIHIQTIREAPLNIIKITDSGEGIPKEKLSSIFDPFFTTKAVGKGTGLGLSIVHSIIERHEGSISVDSKLGEGTTFTIEIPD